MLKIENTKVCVIIHEASATGAPILLLNLLHFLKKERGCQFYIILLRGGVLEHSFKDLGDVIIIKPADYSNKKNI